MCPEPVKEAEESAAAPPGEPQRTLKVSVVEGSVWSFMTAFGDMYIGPFAIFLAASNRAIAFLGTMQPLIGAMAQMMGATLVDRTGRRRQIIVGFAVPQALCYLPLFFIPLLFRGAAVYGLIACMMLMVALGNAGVPAWTSLMGDVVPAETRGDYFGRRSRTVIGLIFVASLMAGGTLHLFKEAGLTWWGFGILFVVATCARLVSARLLWMHYDPPYSPSKDAYFTFWDFIRRMPWSNFARFALYIALMTGATNVAAPFFSVYMLRDLDWSYAQFTVSHAVMLLTQILCLRQWGRIGDRHGNRVIMAATGFILPVLPLMWMVSTDYIYLLFVQVVSGIGWSGFSMAAQNFTYDAVTPQKRARVASYVALLNGICVFIGGTVIGAWLADHMPSAYRIGPFHVQFLSSLPAVFFASGVLRLLATLIMLPRFREVRAGEHVHPAVLILRLAGGHAVADFLSQAALRFARGRTSR